MSRILNFNHFSKLYEAETGQPVTLDTEARDLLDMIIYLVSSCYGSLLSLTPSGEYKETLQDLTSIISAGGDQKGEAMKKIIAKVGASISKEFKEAGLEKLWMDAGNLSADAYTALVDQFKDDKDKSEAAASMVNKRMTKFIEQLKSSKAEHQTNQTNESENFSMINEGWFSGKRGNVNNLIKQGIVVDALLKAEVNNKQLAPDVTKLQSELDSMMAKLAKLSKSRDARKDVDETELDKMAERLTQMPFDLNKKKEQIAKSSKAFSEAASLFVKAQYAASKAYAKEKEVKSGLAQKAESKSGDKSTEELIKLEATISYDKANSGKVNPEVAKVQQLIFDKFKDDPKVNQSALFKKFASFFKEGKADGKFGPATAGLIRALRAGFELQINSNISQKFIDELQQHKMVKESYVDKYLAPFLLEAFDYEAYNKEAESAGGSSGSEAGSNPRASSAGASTQPTSDRSGLETRIADEIERRQTEKDTESLREKIKEIGFKTFTKEQSDARTDKAVGFLNQSNQKYLVFPSFQIWRDSSRRLINLPKDAFLANPQTVQITDESGVVRGLAKELSKAWPQYLWEYYLKLDKYIEGTRSDKTLFPKLNKLKDAEVKTLGKIYKKEKGTNLKTALTEPPNNASEDMKKFAQKYNGVLSAI